MSHEEEKSEDNIFPFEMGYLPDFYIKKAELELNETSSRKTQCLLRMRDMIKDDKDLRNMEPEDDFLVQFLRMKKYDTDKAFSVFKNFINLRKKYSYLLKDHSIELGVRTMVDSVVYILPWRSEDGCTTIVVELDNWDPEVIPVEELKRIVVFIFIQSLNYPMTQVNGFRSIVDAKCRNPLKIIKQLTPQNLYLISHGFQNCIPGRYKGLHVVNYSSAYYVFWCLMKPFLSSKLKNRVHLHSTMDELQNFFPRSTLPEKFGGSLKEYDMTDWLRRAMSQEELEKFAGGSIAER